MKTKRNRHGKKNDKNINHNPTNFAARVTLINGAISVIWALLLAKGLYPVLVGYGIAIEVELIGIFAYIVAPLILHYVLIKLYLKKGYMSGLNASYGHFASKEKELQQTTQALMRTEEKFKSLFEIVNEGIWDEVEGERRFSSKWHDMTGYTEADMANMADWTDLIHPEDLKTVREQLAWHSKYKESYYSCDYRLKFKDGEYRWIQSKAILCFGAENEIIWSVGTHSDINDLKLPPKEVDGISYNDPVMLPSNRGLLYKVVSKSIEGQPNTKKAFIFFDIDNLGHINEILGYMTGDQLLINVEKRLNRLAKGNISVFRGSGDKFIIFIREYSTIEEVETFTQKLIKYMSTPFNVLGRALNITISIGIALYPSHGQDGDTLIKNADIALHRTKLLDRVKYTFYHKSMKHAIKDKMLIVEELRGAIARDEFTLHYQPQYNICDGRILRFEALLRWNNRKMGKVPPAKFIPIAEEVHLINPIGDWVIKESCEFLVSLFNHGYYDIGISVNISVIQLMQRDFCDNLLKTLENYGIDPKYFELEMTETTFIKSYDIVKTRLEYLISRGVSIALDDFGTGYSSLSYLTRIPIDTIKIDKSFIDLIGTKETDSLLLQTIIMLGHQLGLSVVAEGIEKEEQFKYLQEQKCHRVQGFLLSKPLKGDKALDLLGKKWAV